MLTKVDMSDVIPQDEIRPFEKFSHTAKIADSYLEEEYRKMCRCGMDPIVSGSFSPTCKLHVASDRDDVLYDGWKELGKQACRQAAKDSGYLRRESAERVAKEQKLYGQVRSEKLGIAMITIRR